MYFIAQYHYSVNISYSIDNKLLAISCTIVNPHETKSTVCHCLSLTYAFNHITYILTHHIKYCTSDLLSQCVTHQQLHTQQLAKVITFCAHSIALPRNHAIAKITQLLWLMYSTIIVTLLKLLLYNNFTMYKHKYSHTYYCHTNLLLCFLTLLLLN